MKTVSTYSIFTIPQGQKVKLFGFDGPKPIIERLLDMGFHENVEIENLGRLPFSGPLIIRCEQTLLALREEEAMCLIIQI